MAKQPTTKIRKKEKKNITNAIAHVNSSLIIPLLQSRIIKVIQQHGLQLKYGFWFQEINSICSTISSRGRRKKASEHGVKIVDIEVQGPGLVGSHGELFKW